MKNRSRIAILAAALLLGGVSVILVANAADLAAAPVAPRAAQNEQTGEQQDANDQPDATENQAGADAQDPVEATGQQNQVGHQDVPGTPDQTSDNQD